MHVVITGANRGIGHAMAERYKTQNHKVTGTAREGGEFTKLDVTNPRSFANFAQDIGPSPVDLLICNAGVYLDKSETFESGYAAALWAQTFATNVTGVFLTVQALLPQLKRSQNAKIAIISSTMASHTRAPGGSYIYRSSKAAVLNLGRNLATDMRPMNIAVGIYHPGWVRTDMGGSAADIGVDQAVEGLMARFDELSCNVTGCFKTWDGQDHSY